MRHDVHRGHADLGHPRASCVSDRNAMCVCECVSVYTCVHLCECMCMCVCACTCMSVYMCECTHMYEHVSVSVFHVCMLTNREEGDK